MTDMNARKVRVVIASQEYEVTFRFPREISYEEGLRSVIATAPDGPHIVRRSSAARHWSDFIRRRVRRGSLMWPRAVFIAAQAALQQQAFRP